MKILEKEKYIIYRPDEGKVFKFKNSEDLYSEITLKKDSKKIVEEIDDPRTIQEKELDEAEKDIEEDENGDVEEEDVDGI